MSVIKFLVKRFVKIVVALLLTCLLITDFVPFLISEINLLLTIRYSLPIFLAFLPLYLYMFKITAILYSILYSIVGNSIVGSILYFFILYGL